MGERSIVGVGNSFMNTPDVWFQVVCSISMTRSCLECETFLTNDVNSVSKLPLFDDDPPFDGSLKWLGTKPAQHDGPSLGFVPRP